MVMKKQRNLGKFKERCRIAEKMKKPNCGKQKNLTAGKIRRKYLRISQVLQKSHLTQVKEVQSKQIVEHPTTMKLLTEANVSKAFLLPLPKPFCRKYLPVEDTIMVLETDTGEQYKTKYLPRCCILSGGWIRFAKDKKLEVGDVVVFHLVAATKFKVIRKCHLGEVGDVQSRQIVEHPAPKTRQIVEHPATKSRQIVEHPTTMKLLTESNVCKGFYVPLPTPFCRKYLPVEDTIMVLETDTGEQYKVKYLSRPCKLSGGWVRFAKDKKLEVGDVVVFHLVAATKFKVLWKCQLVEAKRVKLKLNTEHLTLVKYMSKSHVSGKSLPLPTPFCKAYLPAEDTTTTLETETGEQYEIKYRPQFCVLSRGWSKFAIDKKLEAGDAVVLHLVAATKFKVCFIREESATKISPPFLLHSSVSHVTQTDSSNADNCQLIGYKRREVHQKSENCNRKSARFILRNAEGSMFIPEGKLFSEIKNFEEFKLVIHNFLQNHELPYYIVHDYYELCSSQNAFLHAHLFKGINPNNQIIIAAIRRTIFDTVNLANALRTCKISTFLEKCALWDKALNVYEALGMNVRFLHARLHHLKKLAFSSEGATYRSRYKEASVERRRVEGEARKLEVILAQLQAKTLKFKPLEEETYKRDTNSWLVCAKTEIRNLEVLKTELDNFFSQYDAHIMTLKLKVKTLELQFQKEASAPW